MMQTSTDKIPGQEEMEALLWHPSGSLNLQLLRLLAAVSPMGSVDEAFDLLLSIVEDASAGGTRVDVVREILATFDVQESRAANAETPAHLGLPQAAPEPLQAHRRPTSVGESSGQLATEPATSIGADIKDIWVAYKKGPTQQLRNILMEHYLHLVRYNAERIHVKLPDEVELDDLMSAGIFGLMDAIDAFDMDRGVKFETYCAPRIRGVILDELRSMDWVPRLVRSRAQKVETATKQLEVELGRSPTSEEIAKRLKIPMAEFEKIAKEASAVRLVSLSRKWFETDKDVGEKADPVHEIERKELADLLTKGLSRAERLIIILYYFEEMTMKQIGAALDLSESRVSQLHSSILARLKTQMREMKEREQRQGTQNSLGA